MDISLLFQIGVIWIFNKYLSWESLIMLKTFRIICRSILAAHNFSRKQKEASLLNSVSLVWSKRAAMLLQLLIVHNRILSLINIALCSQVVHSRDTSLIVVNASFVSKVLVLGYAAQTYALVWIFLAVLFQYWYWTPALFLRVCLVVLDVWLGEALVFCHLVLLVSSDCC